MPLFEYFLPLLIFFLVFVIVFALLRKTKIIGENSWFNFTVALTAAIIFIASSSLKQYVAMTVPWLVAMLVIVFFIVLIYAFIGGGKFESWLGPALALIVVIALIFILLISAINVFAPLMKSVTGGEEAFNVITMIKNPSMLAGILLLLLAALASTILTKKS